MPEHEMSDLPAKDQAQPGQFGPYYLQELLNSGGMADIWLATNSKGETFALRRLRDRSLFSFTARKRFLRGCQILSQIHHHENVIGYVEHGKINGWLYLLMEYLEASNLKQLFARDDPVLAENIGNILIDTASSLEHVHDSGFMHLDFKPENVLVTRNANVRLVDFDLAQPKPDKPRKSSDNPGTPAYMAPEQLLRQPFDHRVDIFAFGVSAYELLTGKKPFGGDTPDEILRRQLDRSQDFVPPRGHNPDIPVALEKVILKCLERDPDKRYPFTSVLVRDLKAALYV
jgi:serine/threonine protein kinase